VLAGADARQEEIALVRQQLGLDRPWPVRLGTWYWRLLHGDLGESFTLGRSVATAIAERAPVTGGLTLYALVLTLVIGVGTGTLAAMRYRTWLDGVCMAAALLGVSLPNFWLGIMFIFLFAVQLGWLPSGGYVPFTESPAGWLRHLTLPAISLAVLQMGLLARITRSSMLEVLGQDYIRTARAVGASERRIVFRHAMRNVLVPVLTVAGIAVSLMLAGTVVIETVYSVPGIGRLVVAGIARRDYPVIQATLLLIAVICLLVNLLVDLLYAVIDPRVRRE
jgi:peptide/nickel transport system permease protein